MSANDLLPGPRYKGPLNEFQAYDRLPNAIRRALSKAAFEWSAADCAERLARCDTIGNIVALIQEADLRAAARLPPRRPGTNSRTAR
jgi:Family of unknown function (DUF6525)